MPEQGVQAPLTRGKQAGNIPVSQRIVESVAQRRNCAVEELPQLYHAIDPEALDGLFSSDQKFQDGYVTFEYAGHMITVHADGQIDIAVSD